jgi:acetolactate synthase-1/2/3 large subunit
MEFVNIPGPVLFNLEIDERHDILPILLGGQDFNKMWPYYDEEGKEIIIMKKPVCIT